MDTIFPAHIRRMSDNTVIRQTCTEHARNTADGAKSVLKGLGLDSSAKLIGLLHDCGKYKQDFKTYLEQAAAGLPVRRGSVVHTFAGVRYLLDRYHGEGPDLTMGDLASEILAFAIGAHHGLFDCVDPKHQSGFLHRLMHIPYGDEEAIRHFLTECVSQQELDQLFEKATEELTTWMEDCMGLSDQNDEVQFLCGLLMRLLTSAVMDGDRRDTAAFMNDAEFPSRADTALWERLLARVEEKLNGFPRRTPIDQARRAISDICRAAAESASGIYRLNVPTGGGKTLSSLRYALAHAAVYEKKRVIFVSPLLSILDQNARVIRDILDEDDLILEHHSNVVQEEQTSEELARQELLTESWSAPIIITTLVQLLNTMFDGKTSCIRRFHALTDAVIVIDEVQTVPSHLLSLFHLTISFLAGLCRTTVILCSATQPCDAAVSHPIRAEVHDLVPYDPRLWEIFRRTELQDAGMCRLEELPGLADQIMKTADSLLIICNKKDEASKLMQLMHGTDYALYHLSAAMCMAHRKETLAQIYRELQTKTVQKVVCIATQVIEAGVDISFDAVIRLSAGMDSMVQAAGRCNRNGEFETLQPVYIAHVVDENLTHLPEIDMAKTATGQLLQEYRKAPEKYRGDLASNEAIRYYYQQFYTMQSHRNREYHDGPVKGCPSLYSMLSENCSWQPEREDAVTFGFSQAFASAGKAFFVFDEDTTDVIVPYGEGKSVIADLSSERAKYDMVFLQDALNRAKGYTVSLYEYQKQMLAKNGGIYPLAGGIALGLAEGFYDKKIGFNENQEVREQCDIPIW